MTINCGDIFIYPYCLYDEGGPPQLVVSLVYNSIPIVLDKQLTSLFKFICCKPSLLFKEMYSLSHDENVQLIHE